VAVDDAAGNYEVATGTKVDPTANVLNLVREAITRQDDLRDRDAEHAREMREMVGRYEDKLRTAESARIDAIREVDVRNQQIAGTNADTRANTLAGQVATTAEAFRVAMAAELSPIKASIEDLRRAQYETQGQKSQIVETRDVRAEGRLNANLVVGCVALLLTAIIIAVAIYSAAHSGG
jgi:hypothetical protein